VQHFSVIVVIPVL